MDKVPSNGVFGLVFSTALTLRVVPLYILTRLFTYNRKPLFTPPLITLISIQAELCASESVETFV